MRALASCKATCECRSARCASGEPLPASWTTQCRSLYGDFSVGFTPVAKDGGSAPDLVIGRGGTVENDVAVAITAADGTRLPVPIAPASFEMRGAGGGVTGLCDKLAAFDLGSGRVLLLLTVASDDDPMHEVEAVLFGRHRVVILDVKIAGNAGGRVKSFAVRAAKAGRIDVRLWTPCIQQGGCDCAQAPVERWRRIAVRGDKLQFKWVR